MRILRRAIDRLTRRGDGSRQISDRELADRVEGGDVAWIEMDGRRFYLVPESVHTPHTPTESASNSESNTP